MVPKGQVFDSNLARVLWEIFDDWHTSIKMNNVNMQHTYVETWFIFVKMQQMQYNSVNMEPIF